jgi:hypothetical protein
MDFFAISELPLMRPFRLAVAIGLAAILTVGCAPGPLSTTWIEPGTPPTPYRDLIVFGISTNPIVRRAYEDNFVEVLKGAGVQARAAHTLLSDRDVGRSRAVQEAVGRSGADGIIVTYLAGENMDAAPSSGRTHVVPSLYGRLYPYYGHILSEVTAPGYYANYRALRLETNLYDAGRAKLVWSGRSDTLDPSSEQTMISEVIAAMIGKLKADGFLPTS